MGSVFCGELGRELRGELGSLWAAAWNCAPLANTCGGGGLVVPRDTTPCGGDGDM